MKLYQEPALCKTYTECEVVVVETEVAVCGEVLWPNEIRQRI